jgi:hypothetical protein
VSHDILEGFITVLRNWYILSFIPIT